MKWELNNTPNNFNYLFLCFKNIFLKDFFFQISFFKCLDEQYKKQR